MIPSSILSIWFSGLFSLGIIGGAVYLLREWYQHVRYFDPRLDRVVLHFDFGANEPTALLLGGLFLLLWAVAGSIVIRFLLRLGSRKSSNNVPTRARDGETHRLRRPDGSELCVERHGLASGPVLLFTHGWGTDSAEWSSVRKDLERHYQVLLWDLPGLGLSSPSKSDDYTLPRFAADLDAVVGLAKGEPVILVGHSIGGMTVLTYCGLFPEALESRIAGLVLVHTTYTNPLRTTRFSGLVTALERPLIRPLLHLTIWLAPLVRAMNWLHYVNGNALIDTKLSSFAGRESFDQVDFAASYTKDIPPAVIARGMFGMLEYDATDTLKRIPVPTLVVAGDRDPVCKPEASERIARDIPDSELALLSPGSHLGYIERGHPFVRLVRTFAEHCFHPTDELKRAQS